MFIHTNCEEALQLPKPMDHVVPQLHVYPLGHMAMASPNEV